MAHVYKIDSDWFVAVSPQAAKLAWEDCYGTDWEGDDPEQQPDDERLTIEERGDDGEDLT